MTKPKKHQAKNKARLLPIIYTESLILQINWTTMICPMMRSAGLKIKPSYSNKSNTKCSYFSWTTMTCPLKIEQYKELKIVTGSPQLDYYDMSARD